MQFGYSTMNTDYGLHPAELATRVEAAGFESLWIGEHNHLPATGRTNYPGRNTGAPKPYRHMMDQFVSLAMAAQATTTLRLATGVMLPLEDTVLGGAKRIATLDKLSGGRLLVGVGVGWNPEELANIVPNISWAQRYRALEEYCAALRALWTNEVAEFSGEFVKFDAVWSYPKPVQKPHPPVLFGGTGRIGIRHAATWADEWSPIDMGERDFGVKLQWFNAALEAAGKPAGSVPVTVFGFDMTRERIERYCELGVNRIVLASNVDQDFDADGLRRHVDELAALTEGLR